MSCSGMIQRGGDDDIPYMEAISNTAFSEYHNHDEFPHVHPFLTSDIDL